MREAGGEVGTTAFVTDLAVCDVWIPQTEVLLEIRVTDTDAKSYSTQSPKEVLQSAENQEKYLGACEDRVTSTVHAYLLLG